MKQVTLAQPMRGVGDNPVLPDSVADRMVKSGEALSAQPWPPRATPAAQKPQRPVVAPVRPAGQLDLREAK